MEIYTVGHSVRKIEEFIALLKYFDIEMLVDIRLIPSSRRNPQFELYALRDSLSGHDIDYIHMPELGGHRKPLADSINTAWKNESFRGYADYMQTAAFQGALDELIKLSNEKKVAIMCAEALPWKCHRNMVADALIARGITVLDIISIGELKEHAITPFAKIVGTDVIYPSEVA